MTLEQILAKYGITPQFYSIEAIEPSEFWTWDEAMHEIGWYAVRFAKRGMPVAMDEKLEVQDGHHRVVDAILDNKTEVLGFVVPAAIEEKFWVEYNNQQNNA